jgi:Glycosyl hydrolase family 26
MSPVTARRLAAVLPVTVVLGLVGSAAPALARADRSATHASTARTPQVTSVARLVTRRHTNVELVRNGGFHAGRAHWHVRGAARPHLRIVHPGHHSRHAARLVDSHRGLGVLAERLTMPQAVRGDRYHATAIVKPLHHLARVALRVNEVKHGVVVGHLRHRVVLRHHRWRRLAINYRARHSGSHLVLHLNAIAHRQRHLGFTVDDVRVIQTVKIVPLAPAPTSTSNPAPTPTPTSEPGAGCAVSATLVPSCGAWWGVYKVPGSTENWETTYTDLEAKVGRPFNLVYRYHDFSDAGGAGQFPDKYEKALGANHILMFSWASRNFAAGTQLRWSDIAAGKYDATVVDPEAARIKAYGQKVFLTFDPEMDRRTPAAGTPAQYVAAYRHIHDEFAADGVTNAVWAWVPTGYSGNISTISQMYPGDAYVDWVGYDPYNFASCHSGAWRDFNTVINGFYQWLETNGYGDKPFILPEYGTVADPTDPAASGDWYANAPAAMATHPNVKAVVEWDDVSAPCDTELTINPGTLAGFTQMGAAPVFNQAPGTL